MLRRLAAAVCNHAPPLVGLGVVHDAHFEGVIAHMPLVRWDGRGGAGGQSEAGHRLVVVAGLLPRAGLTGPKVPTKFARSWS